MQIPHSIPVHELRAEIFRHWRRPLYHLAAEVNVHPATLSSMLRGRLVMSEAVKQRIVTVLSEAENMSLEGAARSALERVLIDSKHLNYPHLKSELEKWMKEKRRGR